MVTFCAIAKSDWPRAAIEREDGEHANCYSWQPFDKLRANGGATAVAGLRAGYFAFESNFNAARIASFNGKSAARSLQAAVASFSL